MEHARRETGNHLTAASMLQNPARVDLQIQERESTSGARKNTTKGYPGQCRLKIPRYTILVDRATEESPSYSMTRPWCQYTKKTRAANTYENNRTSTGLQNSAKGVGEYNDKRLHRRHMRLAIDTTKPNAKNIYDIPGNEIILHIHHSKHSWESPKHD